MKGLHRPEGGICISTLFYEEDSLNYEKIKKQFKKRANELREFVSIVTKIKNYIKSNKAILLKVKGENEQLIHRIRKTNMSFSSCASTLNRK